MFVSPISGGEEARIAAPWDHQLAVRKEGVAADRRELTEDRLRSVIKRAEEDKDQLEGQARVLSRKGELSRKC